MTDTDERPWPDVDRSPSRLAAGVAAALALGSAAAVGVYAWSALGLAALGFAWLLVGVVRGSGRAATGGAALLFAAALAAGAAGAPAVAVVAGATTAVLSWDAAWRAILVGEHLGRAAETRRLEAVGLGVNLLTGVAVAGVTVGVFASATGGQPVAALVFLLVAAVLVASAFA